MCPQNNVDIHFDKDAKFLDSVTHAAKDEVNSPRMMPLSMQLKTTLRTERRNLKTRFVLRRDIYFNFIDMFRLHTVSHLQNRNGLQFHGYKT